MSTNLTTQNRNQVAQFILEGSKDGKPSKGRYKEAQLKFNISRATVFRLWAAAKKQQKNGDIIHLVSGKTTRLHAKHIELDLTLLVNMECTKRGSIRRLAQGLGASKSTVGRWVKIGKISAHTSVIKPDLTATNKLLRLRFSLQSLELDRILNVIKFKDMHNTVHIDEKWFYITKGTHRYYLAPGEPEPYRSCKSKKFIGKIMFICAVTRPLIAENGEVLFDGKIGIFPFVEKVPAKRNSRNRNAGTLEKKPIESITNEVYKAWLINEVVPAVMSKWPEGASKRIDIQQDNARPHILDNDPDFRAAASKYGFDIRLKQQPPNSPDCNVNDLGWFRAIQSLQVETTCNTVDELLHAVTDSFNRLSPHTLNKVFLSLQSCLIEIMKFRGHNSYRVPHMGKEALRRADRLPVNLEVPVELIEACINHLNERGSSDGMADIVQNLGLDIIESA
ncbi:uncharacterized protein LOC131003599 [Salvia miltiorrhiza]|uniref:uncharacterized protein LOC131003599 n=1 Tax=Salvia miltiorrhiza TaxID=226208 RepID=UPI0025AB6802|nr:uncharacterized protein LOC131003599 [Salvia miltiorrhiza]